MENITSNTQKSRDKMSVSDILVSLSDEELKMIEKGKKHWNMDSLSKKSGGYVKSDTIKELIDKVIENTWTQAKLFYDNSI